MSGLRRTTFFQSIDFILIRKVPQYVNIHLWRSVPQIHNAAYHGKVYSRIRIPRRTKRLGFRKEHYSTGVSAQLDSSSKVSIRSVIVPRKQAEICSLPDLLCFRKGSRSQLVQLLPRFYTSKSRPTDLTWFHTGSRKRGSRYNLTYSENLRCFSYSSLCQQYDVQLPIELDQASMTAGNH